jgi:hypothetical protein
VDHWPLCLHLAIERAADEHVGFSFREPYARFLRLLLTRRIVDVLDGRSFFGYARRARHFIALVNDVPAGATAPLLDARMVLQTAA